METRRSYWSRLDRETRRHLKGWALGVLGVVAVVVGICVAHPPTREFVVGCAALVLGVVATPIFFEISLFVAGAIIVLAIAALRSKVEKSEWAEVDLAAPRADLPTGGRFGVGAGVGAGVGTGVPGAADDEFEVALAVVEGYLDLALPEDAWDALVAVPRRGWERPETLAVRLRTYALTRRWREGEKVIALAEATEILAGDAARYHVAHARALIADGVGSGEVPSPRAAKKAAASALRRAVRLDPEIVGAINAEPPLRECVRG